MKNYGYLFALLALLLSSSTSCEGPMGETIFSPRPQVAFKHPPLAQAQVTHVKFTNQTQGEVTSRYWNFAGFGGSTDIDPVFLFPRDGAHTVTLNASGPGGTGTASGKILFYAMPVDCKNIRSSRTHSTPAIRAIRDNGLSRTGQISFRNDYNSEITVDFFSPGPWLDGDYGVTYRWRIQPGQFSLKLSESSPFTASNAWGVRVGFISGEQSCIRTVGDVSSFSDARYTIRATSVYE